MHEPFIHVVGHVGAPPRTRVLASGAVVTDFRIAATPRRVDRAEDRDGHRQHIAGDGIAAGELEPVRSQELTAKLLAAGLPI